MYLWIEFVHTLIYTWPGMKQFTACWGLCESGKWRKAGSTLLKQKWPISVPVSGCGWEYVCLWICSIGSPGLSQSSCFVSVLCRHMQLWPVFTLCVFPCLFLFPSHLHRTMSSNKTNFHLSDQREGWSFSLIIHLQYATSDGIFPVGDWESSLQKGDLMAAGSKPGPALQPWWNLLPTCYDLADSIDPWLHVFCCLMFYMHWLLSACNPDAISPLFWDGGGRNELHAILPLGSRESIDFIRLSCDVRGQIMQYKHWIE